ncbi:protein-L-isoaspartate O-methyltransferase [Candidatus Bathyarchaeota archaeon RBG_16_57_9]|nr:MAG: protein-L-isoaspartate O-methyltransferase [Candidatus Bathyarchaeota archaeon RBG_16_57_9]OGD55867.1 MAG: protein-L-isoaspartate O-methyltransferase [Candidatus Bathyarchaeota archaeon RBG_13_60_20]
MVERYRRAGYVTSRSVAEAMMKVPREEFMDPSDREYAYYDQPFPIPGDGRQTISAPYMYPCTYESLSLGPGTRFLEVGAGSGYGAALARELVGAEGLVVALEINSDTYEFARDNLKRTGYDDVVLVLGDGSLGHLERAPYEAVSVTASTPAVPPPLLEQLASPGRLIAPVGGMDLYGQDLMLIEKDEGGAVKERCLMKVAYVPLTGEHGWQRR